MRCNERQTSTRTARACALLVAVSLVLASALPAQAAVMIGDFEGSAPNWGDWAGGFDPGGGAVFFDPFVAFPHSGLEGTSTYDFSSTNGVTSGTQSLKLDADNAFDFTYAYDAGAAGMIPTIAANDTLTFDITFGAGDPGGWTQIHQVAVNTNSGFQALTTQYSVSGSASDQTVTATYDYSGVSFAGATYLQFIIATNNDGNPTHTTYYLDNVQVSSAIPEPGSFALLSLAGLLLGGTSTISRRSRA